MRLNHYTVLYLSGAMFIVLSLWASIFYVNMIDEIHDSIDDGLENSKILIIRQVSQDSSLLDKYNFFESNYRIREVERDLYLDFKDIYKDTLLYTENEQEDEPYRMLTTVFGAPNGKYYKLRIISSMVEEDDLIRSLVYSLVMLYVVLILSVVIINYVLIAKIWKSFYETLKKIRGYKLSDKEELNFKPAKVIEFRRLQETLKELIQSNKEVYLSQKQFIENASHELQTPLAISINKLELLAENVDFTEEQAHQLGGIIDTLERLTKLNSSLLLLSKIDNKQFAEVENVSMNTLINGIMEEFKELARYKEVSLIINEKQECQYNMSANLASVLFTNLIKNALVHTEREGEVYIEIHNNKVVIENSGDKALDSNQIFKRFYKDSRKTSSTGLGLAIVKSISDLYNLQISYVFNGAHRFEVHFN